MLLRFSPIHTRRLRRIALAMTALGVLILVSAIVLGYGQRVQAARAQEEYLQRVSFNPFGAPDLAPPFLNARSGEIVYTPGQTALAFAEGFQPHEPLFVRLYSRTRGLLDAYPAQADGRGQSIVARPLETDENSELYTPPGGLWFQFEALSGYEQVFRFRLEMSQMPEATATKGVYPSVVVPGTLIAFWCSGLHPGDDAIVKITVDGDPFRSGRIKTYPVSPDGLLLGTLMVSLDDPTGEWRVVANHCQLDFPVRSTLNAIPVSQGGPHVDHTP